MKSFPSKKLEFRNQQQINLTNISITFVSLITLLIGTLSIFHSFISPGYSINHENGSYLKDIFGASFSFLKRFWLSILAAVLFIFLIILSRYFNKFLIDFKVFHNLNGSKFIAYTLAIWLSCSPLFQIIRLLFHNNFLILIFFIFYLFLLKKIYYRNNDWSYGLIFLNKILILSKTSAFMLYSIDYSLVSSSFPRLIDFLTDKAIDELKTATAASRFPLENIFIVNSKIVKTAASSKDFYHSIILINRKLFKSDFDSLKAIILHEIGHVVNNHGFKKLLINLVVILLQLAVAIFIGNRYKKNFNNLEDFINLQAMFFVIYSCSMFVGNLINHRFEFVADKYCADAGYGDWMAKLLQTIGSIYPNILDYQWPFSMLFTHHSIKQRINSLSR